MENSRRISPEALTDFASDVTQSLGAAADRARTTAEVLAAADLRGISSHGVAGGTGLRELVDRTRLDAIDITALPEVKRKSGWAVAAMNANGGLGHPAAMEAARLAGDLAEEYGCGRVHVHDGNHFGAACVYVEALIARGFAARATCTAGAWMMPYGGSHVRLGTNPIAWGLPCGDEAIVIDIATTQRAVSPAIRATRSGAPIPPDYFKDKDGNVLEGVVPYESLIGGSVLPLGGETFGYKGSGLNILVELDNVIGGGSTERVKNMRETPKSRVSQTFEAWRIDFLFPEEEARRRLEETISDIRKYGGPEMLLPGEREARHMADARASGIPYEEAQWEMLRGISKDTGIEVPAPLSA
ncbi:MAG: Ldh family oxidoreductase [Nitrospinota bacterium]|jgi:LDH2 family malate/lactate/ureidoglycolate dehydrogenase|nr:Ldh family oxidoreductase [Nitrospinota bacterium]